MVPTVSFTTATMSISKSCRDKRGASDFHCHRKVTDVKMKRKSSKTHSSSARLELETGSRSSLTAASHFPPCWSSSWRTSLTAALRSSSQPSLH